LSKKAQKSTKKHKKCMVFTKKCALFTKKYEKIPIFHHFLRVYPELFEGQNGPKPTTLRQIEMASPRACRGRNKEMIHQNAQTPPTPIIIFFAFPSSLTFTNIPLLYYSQPLSSGRPETTQTL
jgi:hypothetical protein